LIKQAGLVQFPVPSTGTLIALAVLATLTAMGLWLYQRYRKHEKFQIRLAHETHLMKKQLSESKLPKEDSDYFQKLVMKFFRKSPLAPVSSREPFNQLVTDEMNALEKRGDMDDFLAKGIKLREVRNALRLDHVPIGHRIHSTREIHAGLWIFVAPIEGEKLDWIRLMVQEVDEAYFYISPDSKGRLPAFHDNETVRCRFWMDEDARYIFDSPIVKRPGTQAQWRLTHTSDLKRTQNRAHFRIRYSSDASIGLVNAPADLNSETLKKRKPVSKLRGKITSLSAGGIAVVMPQPISDRVVLRVELAVENGASVLAHVKIISTSTISGGRSLMRGCFVGLDDTDRDQLAKFIVHKQQQAILVENEKST